MSSRPIRAAILGAAGRDFHNFNTFFRDNPDYHVAAFTAAQVPGIAGRRYPAASPESFTRREFPSSTRRISRA